VAVVVARADHEVLAMTVNAVSSVSLEPMLVMFCPGKHSRLAAHIARLSGFTINILREDQQALSTYFAGGWKAAKPPPFRLVPSRCAPRLEGSLASIDCEPHQVIEVGDHWMVIGHVLALHTGIHPHRPLLFLGGKYRHLDSAGSAPAPDLSDVHDEPAHIYYE
jgi:flavin reductase (DIM6/NTAB) family NADH-FMN oxidoreductase RutF